MRSNVQQCDIDHFTTFIYCVASRRQEPSMYNLKSAATYKKATQRTKIRNRVLHNLHCIVLLVVVTSADPPKIFHMRQISKQINIQIIHPHLILVYKVLV